jgi:Tfp pilus assembly protein PilN
MKAVNLLPPDLRGAAKPATALAADEPTGRMAAFGVLGALAFCVVALAAYVLTGNTVKDRQAQLDQVTAQATSVAQQAAKLKPYADFAAQAQQRVQTVKDLASARFDWEQALRDVSRAVPANVTLSTLSGTIAGDASGGGSGGLRGTIPSPAIEMQGCTTGGQTDVATLLSRLRNVDGVTRVSLESSVRPDAAAPGTVTTSQSSTGPAGCGSKRPDQFNLVIFFEHSTVPATVDSIGTGATGAPTSAAGGAAAAANGAASTSSSSASTSSSTSTPTSTSSSTSTPTSTTPSNP